MSVAVYTLAASVILLFLRSLFSRRSLRSIPTVGGPSAPLLSYIGAYNYVHNSVAILQEGTFKIPMLSRWLVVVTGFMLVDEVQKLSDDQVSFREASGELSSVKYIFSPAVRQNPYHIGIIRQQLTRSLAMLFPEIIDEIATAFEELVPCTTTDWTGIDALGTARRIVSRTSNRVFLGLPYCRNEEYLQILLGVAAAIARGRIWIDFFPQLLKPLAAKAITNIDSRVDDGIRCLHELLYNRIRETEKFGDDWSDRPNDMLQWIIDEERKTGSINIRTVVQMLFLINFVAIHTSTNSFTHALYHVAANSEYQEQLRGEIEAVVRTEGWTKAAMGKMRKLDSFMRESQRLNGINGVALKRMVIQDLTLCDGTFLPAGTIFVTPVHAMHSDEDNYTNPDDFDPWRFSNIRATEGEDLKHHYVSTSTDYISFGLGRHACPGRFFAANELKAMLAHVIMNYDVKFENEGVRPRNKWFGMSLVPDPTARVLFRKRQTSSTM
ncbi:hypothetical protein EIP86_003572 [Pleurotus ostreatoroseus]|nr:hypothetical protein EIP86_003572 [Pleurotus ostreatoroseus]